MNTRLRACINSLSNSEELDWSEFVLCVTGIFENKIGSKAAVPISILKEQFLHNHKKGALDTIRFLCHSYDEIRFDNALLNLILNKMSILKDNPMKLDSRRYFEFNFSHGLWNTLNEIEFKSIEKLSHLIHKISYAAPSETFYPPGKVFLHRHAEKVIAMIREFCDKTKEIDDRHREIRNESPLSPQKDRGPKKEAKVFSSSPSIMRALACVPPDEIVPIRENPLTDTFLIDEKKENGYSQSRRDVPFVNSISGTTYAFVTVLERYIQEHKTQLSKKSLQLEVNNLIKAFISFSCKNGYHSLAEMMDVLKDPAVTKLMNSYGLILNLDYSRETMDYAYTKSIDYTIKLCFQRILNKEINQIEREKKYPPSEVKSTQTVIEETSPDLKHSHSIKLAHQEWTNKLEFLRLSHLANLYEEKKPTAEEDTIDTEFHRLSRIRI